MSPPRRGISASSSSASWASADCRPRRPPKFCPRRRPGCAAPSRRKGFGHEAGQRGIAPSPQREGAKRIEMAAGSPAEMAGRDGLPRAKMRSQQAPKGAVLAFGPRSGAKLGLTSQRGRCNILSVKPWPIDDYFPSAASGGRARLPHGPQGPYGPPRRLSPRLGSVPDDRRPAQTSRPRDLHHLSEAIRNFGRPAPRPPNKQGQGG